MAPKLNTATKIAAIALAVAAVGSATVPVASAADNLRYFGVKSVYSETPSIVGFRGYFGSDGTAPGNGAGGTTDPGTGSDGGTNPGDGGTIDPGDGSGNDPAFPAECTVSNELNGPFGPWFGQTGTMDGTNYLIPQTDNTSSSNPYGYSKAIDEAIAQGATITVGKPSAFLPQVNVELYDPSTRKSTTERLYAVDFSEFNQYGGTAKAVPAGTIQQDDFPSYYNADKRTAADYGSVQIKDMDLQPVGDLINSEEFFKKVGATYPTDYKKPYYTVYSNLLAVNYPVTVDWPADSKYAKCSTTVDATYSYSFGDA